MKRGFWLTSLIVGASILVWLTILGSVIVGAAVGYELAHDDNSTTVYVPTDQGTWRTQPLDSYGVPCSQSESKSGC